LKRKNEGFTLVELIVVVVLLGILGTATFAFLGFGGNVFRDSVERSALASEGRFIVTRLSRELKNALPMSVRVNGTCVEFAPISASSLYLTLPTVSVDSDFIVADSGFIEVLDDYVGSRVFVYANTSENIYGSVPGDERWYVIQGVTSAGNELTFDIDGERFSRESPARRYYIVESPVSWCQSSGNLYRYEGYNWSETQPTQAQLSADCALGGCEESLMGTQLNTPPGVEIFRVEEPTLVRSALVQVELHLQRLNSNEVLIFLHEVHLPNVP